MVMAKPVREQPSAIRAHLRPVVMGLLRDGYSDWLIKCQLQELERELCAMAEEGKAFRLSMLWSR